ncbi:MAG: DUF6447 family protein [Synechococcaceae cyanobacterium]|nr:DUF6447 family protein [Synechococcaceae cyanobacterium]
MDSSTSPATPPTDPVPADAANPTITLAGKQYAYDSLSEPARQLVAAIRSSEEEMKSIRNQLALMDVGRRALVAQLRLAVENPEAFQRLQNPESANPPDPA